MVICGREYQCVRCSSLPWYPYLHFPNVRLLKMQLADRMQTYVPYAVSKSASNLHEECQVATQIVHCWKLKKGSQGVGLESEVCPSCQYYQFLSLQEGGSWIFAYTSQLVIYMLLTAHLWEVNRGKEWAGPLTSEQRLWRLGYSAFCRSKIRFCTRVRACAV